MDIVYYKKYFDDYVKKYLDLCKNEDERALVEYRIAHTYRVRDNMVRIAKSCNLLDSDLKIAEIIALFHDIGRFKQFYLYGTYDDKVSVNHAIYSANVVKEDNILAEFSKEDFDIIYKAIYYHNVYKIQDELTAKERYFLDMIRDADRLDIYKGMADYVPNISSSKRYVWYNEREDTKDISDLIYSQILENISPSMKDCKSVVESQFARMSWIFHDFAFKEAINIIINEKYFEKIHDDMKKSEKSEIMYEYKI